MLKVWPSKFIPVINAGHEEYISKTGAGWGRVSRPCEGLGVTQGPGESEHMLCGPGGVVWVCGWGGREENAKGGRKCGVRCGSLGGGSFAFGLGVRPP